MWDDPKKLNVQLDDTALSGFTRTGLGGFEQDLLGRSAGITITFPTKTS
jgi:hypothetical protein